jgi:hypothetical protein
VTSLQDFIDAAHIRAGEYKRGTAEQALVYACEDVVEQELGSRDIPSSEAASILEEICHAEDIEVPRILVARKAKSSLALTYIDENVICVRGKKTTWQLCFTNLHMPSSARNLTESSSVMSWHVSHASTSQCRTRLSCTRSTPELVLKCLPGQQRPHDAISQRTQPLLNSGRLQS